MLLEFKDCIEQFRERLPVQIRRLWSQRQSDQKTKKGLNKISSKELLESAFDIIKCHFPIILTNKQVLGQVFDFKGVSFDQAFMIDEDYEEDNKLEHIAQRSLLFYSNQSLEKGILSSRVTLKLRHKSMALPAFYFAKQNTFSTSLELAAFPDEEKSSFRVMNAEGRFRHKVNVKEAEAIVSELISLVKTGAISGFKVALVCITVEQRDFIRKKLLLLQKSNSSDAVYANKLLDSSLGIFHLFEKRASGYDYLIFSLGLEKFSNVSNEVVSALNSRYGFLELNKLMSACWRRICIFHSISNEEINEYVSYNAKKSMRLLANWIKIGNEFSSGIMKINEIPEPQDNFGFIQEISNELIPFIGKSRIQQNKFFKGVQFPLLIDLDRKDGKVIAILTNNSLHYSQYQSHLWNLYYEDYLKSEGIIPVNVWSARWFKHPALEARRLASYILKMDKRVEGVNSGLTPDKNIP